MLWDRIELEVLGDPKIKQHYQHHQYRHQHHLLGLRSRVFNNFCVFRFHPCGITRFVRARSGGYAALLCQPFLLLSSPLLCVPANLPLGGRWLVRDSNTVTPSSAPTLLFLYMLCISLAELENIWMYIHTTDLPFEIHLQLVKARPTWLAPNTSDKPWKSTTAPKSRVLQHPYNDID